MLNTLNSSPNATEWGRLFLLALLDFSDEHEVSVSVLCRESTELKLPEIFLWACLMDRKKRTDAWRMKPNLWLPFSASSSIHAPNKPEMEQMSDSIYSFSLVESQISNQATNTTWQCNPQMKNFELLEIPWSTWRFVKFIPYVTQQVPNKLNIIQLSFEPTHANSKDIMAAANPEIWPFSWKNLLHLMTINLVTFCSAMLTANIKLPAEFMSYE